MARFWIFILGLALIFFAFSPLGEAAPKPVIAVMPIALNADTADAEGLGMDIAAMLVSSLSKSGEFVVVELGKTAKLLHEQGFRLARTVDTDSAAKIGETLGAQAVILGSVTELRGKKVGFPFKMKMNRVKAVLNIQMVDVETGRVLTSERGWGEDFSAEDALRWAIRRLVPKIVASGKNLIWSGRVATVKDGVVYVAAGRDIGLLPGDALTVVREGNEIKDPTTGAVLSKDTQRIGKLQVTGHRGDRVTTARLVEGQDARANDVVQYIPSSAPAPSSKSAPVKEEDPEAEANLEGTHEDRLPAELQQSSESFAIATDSPSATAHVPPSPTPLTISPVKPGESPVEPGERMPMSFWSSFEGELIKEVVLKQENIVQANEGKDYTGIYEGRDEYGCQLVAVAQVQDGSQPNPQTEKVRYRFCEGAIFKVLQTSSSGTVGIGSP